MFGPAGFMAAPKGTSDEKGQYGGKCNRSACLAPGAFWYNHSTRAYYCEDCARMINVANRKDAMELFGHDLCTFGRPDDSGR